MRLTINQIARRCSSRQGGKAGSSGKGPAREDRENDTRYGRRSKTRGLSLKAGRTTTDRMGTRKYTKVGEAGSHLVYLPEDG